MIFVRTALLSLRMLSRSPLRAVLAVLAIAVAVLLLCAERAMHEGVTEATSANERDTRLIVYRANRFCPFTSRIPERYTDDIMRIPGVKSAIPMQIVVSNCRASLDVIVFRGVRAADAERTLGPRLHFRAGSMRDFLGRGDGALVGSALAERRHLKVGDLLNSAGVAVTVCGIVEAEGPQDRNACFVQLPFLQSANGRAQGGEVTQFEVEVDDPRRLSEVAAAIDEHFASDATPTSTRAEKAFVARAAEDLVAIARFAGWLGLGALVAVFALVANSIVLSLEGRTREIAILQSIGFKSTAVAWTVLVESTTLAMLGSILGAGVAYAILAFGKFGLGAEGVQVEFRPSISLSLVAIGASVCVGIAAGAVPAISVARRPIVEGLKTS